MQDLAFDLRSEQSPGTWPARRGDKCSLPPLFRGFFFVSSVKGYPALCGNPARRKREFSRTSVHFRAKFNDKSTNFCCAPSCVQRLLIVYKEKRLVIRANGRFCSCQLGGKKRAPICASRNYFLNTQLWTYKDTYVEQPPPFPELDGVNYAPPADEEPSK